MTVDYTQIERIAAEHVAHANRKPTPAQTRWLILIAGGGVMIDGSGSWVNGMRDSTLLGRKKSTYVMTCNLQEAGWIQIVAGAFPRISLTIEGLRAIGRSAS